MLREDIIKKRFFFDNVQRGGGLTGIQKGNFLVVDLLHPFTPGVLRTPSVPRSPPRLTGPSALQGLFLSFVIPSQYFLSLLVINCMQHFWVPSDASEATLALGKHQELLSSVE